MAFPKFYVSFALLSVTFLGFFFFMGNVTALVLGILSLLVGYTLERCFNPIFI